MMRSLPDAGFLGAPIVAELDALDADVAIVGIPHGVAYPAPGLAAGCADAPAAIRARSQRLARFRGHHDFDIGGPMLPPDGRPRIADVGDVTGAPHDGAANAERAEAVVRGILDRGAAAVVLGGDDSVPIPVLRAFADRGPLSVLQVDAHLDFRDEVAGVRHGYSSPMRRASEMTHVAGAFQVGLRGAGSARSQDVSDAIAAGNRLVTARELNERGVPWLVDLLPQNEAIFVSLDLDGLDPSVCPAVSAPAPGGLTYQQAADLLAGAAMRCRVVGAAVTELVPAIDDGLSALVAARLIIRLLTAIGSRD